MREGLMLGKERVRLIAYGIPKLVFDRVALTPSPEAVGEGVDVLMLPRLQPQTESFSRDS